MDSLRSILTDTLGEGLLSLRDAAVELGFNGAFTLLELSAAYESGVDGPFTPLHPVTDGTAQWRADRFRIYFFADRGAPFSEGPDFDHFENLFPQIFDGVGPDVEHVEGMIRNKASNFFHPNLPINGRHSLQFIGAARAFFQQIDIPDLHDDWVGIIHQQFNSFAVQTMKRNFVLEDDVTMGALTTEALATLITAGGATIGTIFGGPVGTVLGALLGSNPVINIGGGIYASSINRYHFLAGFRSWKLGKLPTFEIENLPGSQFNIYYLETAAIDRYSSWLIDLADLFGDVGIGEVDVLTRDIWTIMANNWGRYGVEELGYNLDIDTWQDDIDRLAGPPFAFRDGNVFINQASFASKEEMMDQAWVVKLLHEHPGIAAQF